MFKVFLSHSNKLDDWERIQRLEMWLSEIGVVPILARRIHKPEPVADKVLSLIDESDALVALWTKSSSASVFVNHEIGHAYSNKPLFILRDPGVELAGFVYGIDTIELGSKNINEEFEKFRASLLELKDAKELVGALFFGLLAIAGIIGFMLLLSRSK